MIALGGDYVETRVLSSGPRTNPWFQETADRRLAERELVALDTDVVGCHGYYCGGFRFVSGAQHPRRRRPRVQRTSGTSLPVVAFLRRGLRGSPDAPVTLVRTKSIENAGPGVPVLADGTISEAGYRGLAR